MALLDDPGVDVVLGIFLALPVTDFAEVAEVFGEARRRHPGKPIFVVLFGSGVKARWLRTLGGLEIPVESDTRLPIRGIRAMVDYDRRRRRRAAESRTPSNRQVAMAGDAP